MGYKSNNRKTLQLQNLPEGSLPSRFKLSNYFTSQAGYLPYMKKSMYELAARKTEDVGKKMLKDGV